LTSFFFAWAVFPTLVYTATDEFAKMRFKLRRPLKKQPRDKNVVDCGKNGPFAGFRRLKRTRLIRFWAEKSNRALKETVGSPQWQRTAIQIGAKRPSC